MEENQVLTKKCTKCGEEKPVSEFYASKITKDGLHSYCKDCHALYYQRRRSAIRKVYSNPKLAEFQPRELIAELKARGYTGELRYTQKITV